MCFILFLIFGLCCAVPKKCDTFPARYTQPYQDVKGPPYNIEVDTVSDIKKLQEKQYDRDYDFQRDMMEAVGKAKDAHTAYMPPLCFGGYVVALPFGATSKLVTLHLGNDTKKVQKLYVKKSRMEGMDANYTRIYPELGEYTSKYIGWEIVKINGEDAMEYLLEYAITTNTYSRDKAVRFNDAIEQFFMHSCMRERFPDKPSVKFELSPPPDLVGAVTETVDPKYVVYPLFDIEGLGWEFLCGYGGLSANAPSLFRRSTDELSNMLLDLVVDPGQTQLSIHHGLTIPIIEEHAKYHLTKRNSPLMFDPLYLYHEHKIKEEELSSTEEEASVEETEEEESGYTNPLFEKLKDIDGPDIYSYLRHPNSSDEKLTGFLQVRNFYPQNINLVYKWALDIHKSLTEFRERKVERLVVDLRKNGGGILCLGWMLVKYLSKYAPEAMYPFGDMKSTEFWRKFYCKNNIFGYKFMFVDEERQPNPSTFLTDMIKTEKNGVVSEYSQMISPECTVFRYVYIDDILDSGRDLNESPVQFEPENLILLTDGKCGSTCGMVVKLVQTLKLGRIVSQGGVWDWKDVEEMAVASFKGASVMMSTPLYQQIDYSLGCLLLCDCKKLNVLPGFQMVTFSWLELFTYNQLSTNDPKVLNRTDPQPAEYHRKGADGHIWNWDFDLDFSKELTTVYNLVLPYFGEARCLDWEVIRDDTCKPDKGGRIPNGVYGHPCNQVETGGEYDLSRCVLRGCEKGYYYSLLDFKSGSAGECLKMAEEYNMARYLFTILACIAVLVTLLFTSVCCGLCLCYLCLFGGFGWGCYAFVMFWQTKKYGKRRKKLGPGYINVLGDEGILDNGPLPPPPPPRDDDDDDENNNNNQTRIEFEGVAPLLGESSINI